MICLFLDTSSNELNVSFIDGKKIIFEKKIATKNDHSSYLVSTIRDGLDKCHLKPNDISKIFVTVGPGSFTGIRIGITVAKALAWSLSIPVIPVSSLKQYIFEYDNYDYYVPIIEEKNNNIYYCIYDSKFNDYCEEKYSNIEELFDELNKLNGKILLITDKEYSKYNYSKKNINFIKLANYYFDDNGVNPHSLKPNYIKKIEVESKL